MHTYYYYYIFVFNVVTIVIISRIYLYIMIIVKEYYLTGRRRPDVKLDVTEALSKSME